jgi:hypothetical protein
MRNRLARWRSQHLLDIALVILTFVYLLASRIHTYHPRQKDRQGRDHEDQFVDPFRIDRYARIGGPHHGSSPFLYAVPATLPVQSAVPETIIVQSAVRVQSAI